MTKSLIDFDLTQLNQTELNKTPRPGYQDQVQTSPPKATDKPDEGQNPKEKSNTLLKEDLSLSFDMSTIIMKDSAP